MRVDQKKIMRIMDSGTIYSARPYFSYKLYAPHSQSSVLF